MSNLDITKYTNHLPLFKISSQEVESQIRNFKLCFKQVKNKQVEWVIKFPAFIPSFYKYVYHRNNLPSQEAYCAYYLRDKKDWFAQQSFSPDILDGLQARLFRAYPSFVRDLHFAKRLSETLDNCEIVYNTYLDVEEGIDLLVIVDGKIAGVNLYTHTARAHIGRAKKEKRHHVYDNINYIELPVNFKGSHQIGNFFLYGEREIQTLKNKLSEL